MNQPNTPVDPGFADLNPSLDDVFASSLDEVIADFVSRNPEMVDDMAPDAFEDSAYDVGFHVKHDSLEAWANEPLVYTAETGKMSDFRVHEEEMNPPARFRPRNYDAAVASGYEGTFSDWLRENVENGYDFTFQSEEPKVPVWHKVAAVIMVLAIAAVVVAVFTQWRDGGAPPVATKSIIVGGQA